MHDGAGSPDLCADGYALTAVCMHLLTQLTVLLMSHGCDMHAGATLGDWLAADVKLSQHVR